MRGFRGAAILAAALILVLGTAGGSLARPEGPEEDAAAKPTATPPRARKGRRPALPEAGFWEEADRLVQGSSGSAAVAEHDSAGGLVLVPPGSDPERRIVLAPPALDESLVGWRIELRRISTGAFYEGTVTKVDPDRLHLDVGSTIREEVLPLSDIDTVITLSPAEPLVFPGDEVTLLSRRGERVSGTVMRLLEDATVLDLGGYEGTVNWSQVREVAIWKSAARDRGPLDVEAAGITPIAVHQPAPKYPERMRQAGVTGIVIIQIVVDDTGRVSRYTLLTEENAFSEAGIEAVTQWRYRPVIVDGKAIWWKAKINLRFQLR